MNKEELLKKYDEKAKALRDEFISKLEDDEEKFEVELPDDKEEFWFIAYSESRVYRVIFDVDDLGDKTCYLNGEYFETKEEAEQHLKERKLLFKLHQWTKEQQGDWKPDWNNENEGKHYMGYHYEDKCIYVVTNKSCDSFLKLPYFKSKEITRACIDEFGDEILEVFC